MIEFLESQFLTFSYLIVFSGAFFESVVLTGMFLPGSIFVLLGGYYAQRGEVDLLLVITLGTLGMFLGDLVNYYLGQSPWHRVMTHRIPALRSEKRRRQIAEFLRKWGFIAIFYMHFLGSLRSILSFIAGMVDYPLPKYAIASFLSSIVWSSFFGISGFYLAKSTQDVGNFQKQVSLFALGLLVLFVIIKLAHSKLLKKFNPL